MNMVPAPPQPPKLPAWDNGAVRFILGALGLSTASCSSFFVAAAIGDLLTYSDTEPGVLLGLMVFFGFFAVTGLFAMYKAVVGSKARRALGAGVAHGMAFQAHQQPPHLQQAPAAQPQSLSQKDRNRERLLLHLAKVQEGKLTPADVALRTELSIAEAESALHQLELSGAAESWVNSSGQMIWVFPSFVTDMAALKASNPMGASPDQFFAEHGIDESVLDFDGQQPIAEGDTRNEQSASQAHQAFHAPHHTKK